MKAIFLGKFQPPHLGHIRTILKIAKEYEFVIVGITMGEPKVIQYEEVRTILEEVFSTCNNISIRLIDGTIEDDTSNIDTIDFDVVVSGNQKVLDILKNKGYKTKFQSRTEGKGYSGSEIRGLIENHSSIYIENRNKGYDFKIIPISLLKPLELVYPSHFKNIEKLILKDGVIKRPIIIDAKYNIVLDGSHRYAFLLKYGFKYAPVIVVNYDDDSIFVGNHLSHRYLTDENLKISKSQVVSKALNENLFNARTTRHFFPFRKKDYPVSLSQLEKGKSRNINYLIQDCSIDDELMADREYLNEIDQELKVIDSYIEEQINLKEYISYQITEMEKGKYKF
ncbi:cytidyltransferase-like domain protein [Francisella philomiragia]|uniref:adenylyltransferase/cytidyltransferase family protein n=1 Tax=Francisella philomiragia TaxID=28110 RepID=UPI0005A57882|nr:adenylyltransferase/cytidyltransferase family protein [Francisella philomiragia]AJI56769.1 cytidyltransferase-like domain protein [Francisella philomiragia]